MRTSLEGSTAWRGRLALLAGVTAIAVPAAAAAAPDTPIAPATSNGDYTVIARGCNDNVSNMICLAEWLEERVEPGGTFATTAGTFTNKPYGVYSYRSADMYCNMYYTACTTRYSAAVSVVVGSAPGRDPLDVQRRYTFRARIGNVVGGAGTDILIERTKGGTSGNGVIDAVLLRQDADRKFTPLVPTRSQRQSSAWSASALEVRVEDINVDGYVDVVVGNVASAIPRASDQIVYSPGVAGHTPKGIRAIDAGLRQFTANMLDYVVDNGYFENNAPLKRTLVGYPVSTCPSPYYDDLYYMSCYTTYLYGYVYLPDYSVFNARAVDIWRQENALIAGTATRAQATQAILNRVAQMIGVTVGGWDLDEILGSSGPHDDPSWVKGIEAFISIIGIGTAHADGIDTTRAPRQIDRQTDVIYITGRYVFGSGVEKLHSALYYRTPGVAAPSWLSAFDSDESLLGDGKLYSSTNDPRDNPLLMRFTLGTVRPPTGFSPYSHFVVDLVPAHERYRRRPFSQLPDYDAIPEIPPCGGCAGRNSNGYVNGLIRAAGGRPRALPPLRFNDLFGWEFPVEPFYFGK